MANISINFNWNTFDFCAQLIQCIFNALKDAIRSQTNNINDSKFKRESNKGKNKWKWIWTAREWFTQFAYCMWWICGMWHECVYGLYSVCSQQPPKIKRKTKNNNANGCYAVMNIWIKHIKNRCNWQINEFLDGGKKITFESIIMHMKRMQYAISSTKYILSFSHQLNININ